MSNQRLVSLLTAFASFTVGAGAAGQDLSLSEAVVNALKAHPSIGVADARVAMAEASIDEAESARWPRISFTDSIFQYEEPMVVTPIHGFEPGLFPEFDDTLIQNALNVEVLLWDGGGVPARIQGSESDLDVARTDLATAREALIVRTAATYLTVLTRAHELDSHDARITALEAEKSRVGQLIDVGRAAEVDMLRVEAALAAAAAERSEISAGLEAAERELARLTGTEPGAIDASDAADVALIDQTPADRETLTSIAVENNPTIRRARDEVRSREAAVAAARSIYFPQVRAIGSWLQFGDDSLEFEDEWNVGVRIRVPIWDGGTTSARVARARAGVRAAQEQVRLEEHRALDRLDMALASLEEADANVASLEVASARFEEVARIEKLRLTTGTGTQTDYLRSEADLLQARAGLAAARYRCILSRIELAQVLGELDPSWFDRHLTTPTSGGDS